MDSPINNKIEVIQNWLNYLAQNHTLNSQSYHITEILLNDVIILIQKESKTIGLGGDLSVAYADFEAQAETQIQMLNQATQDLRAQIAERELSALNLQKAYDTLEAALQEHIANHLHLNQQLQEQVVEYKRIQTIEKEERAFTEALRDTLATMSNMQDLDKILDHILNTVGQVTAYDGANILLVESDLVRVVRQRGYIEEQKEEDWVNRHIPMMKLAILQQLMDIGTPVVIADTSTSPMWIGFPNLKWVNSNLIAPIRSNGKILGFLSLDSAKPNFFTQVDAERLQTFANQAAVAIQNARLLDRAKHAAVMAERNRLANELHDTISQALWSISLITERLPMILEINKDELLKSLAVLHQLSQNALEEMRSLLLELHPSSLNNTQLGDLIHQVATIISNRTGLKIDIRVGEQEALPDDVHFALYRVVQEALNNIVLHASATLVEIDFSSLNGAVELIIVDNGIGFNPLDVVQGHLGLRIMRDRIENIRGTFEIFSHKGEGTRIKINWNVVPESVVD
ncbi:MAG: GAF domain-containing sensor histidine kinase [Anaerolineae bacterium]|nr:GAF domain-containing sensor histidine kinase [Anaerolineae bacterium]